VGPNRNRITLLTMGTVVACGVLVRTGAGDPLDRAARDALARPLGPRADLTIGAVTDLGSIYGLAGIATTLFVGGRRRAALDSALAGTAAWAVAQSLKPTLDRPRPYQVDAAERLVAVPAGSSWPSGHSAVAAATATSLSPHLGPVSRTLAAGFVGTVAVSRLYVGVHHLTDVVAGVAVGHLCARAVRGLRRAVWGPRTRGGRRR
jgi:membrane-associated phospholipid phosphatase